MQSRHFFKSKIVTEERIETLENVGFVWESQNSQWTDRLNELKDFREAFGHCNVPSRYSENKKLFDDNREADSN